MKIALCQTAIAWGQPDRNLETLDRKLSAPLGCDIILLPEMFASGCLMTRKAPAEAAAQKAALAARFAGIRDRMLRWAQRQDALVMGSTAYTDGARTYNRMLIAFPDGALLHYDKRHCFRLGGEREHYSPGASRTVFSFRGFRIAAFICYDLRFPVWCRNAGDYDLAVFVANWPSSRREAWLTLLRARAIENQAYVAAVNCVGEDPYGIRYTGDSALWDARGDILASAAPGNDEILIATADLQSLSDFRSRFPVLDDRDPFAFLG